MGSKRFAVGATSHSPFFSSPFQVTIDRLVAQTEATPLSSPYTGNDIYDTMFSDSTRGDIQPSELGSGGSSSDDDFTVFDTTFFVDNSLFTTVEKSDTPVSGATGKTGTTEFGTEVTESSDITDESDATAEGSGAFMEETAFTEETALTEETTEGTADTGSTFLSYTLVRIF